VGATGPASITPATLTTANNTPTAILTFAHPDNTINKWLVSIVGRDAGNNGDYWIGDFVFNTQRATSLAADALQLRPASPTVSNNDTVGGGGAYAVSIATSGNNLVVTVTGAAARNVNWTLDYQALPAT
jgi:hypothetical protein